MFLINKNSIVMLFFCTISYVSAYKYLIVSPTNAPSHYNVDSALAKGLAAAGHEVTLIAYFSQKKPVKNLNEVVLPNLYETMGVEFNLYEFSKLNIIEAMTFMANMGLEGTELLLKNQKIKELLRSNQTFDAVITEVCFNEAHLGFAEHFNAPLIGLGAFGAILWNTDLVGSPSPPSYVPNALLKLTDHMSFWERIINLAFTTYERAYFDLYYLPEQEKIYKKYFPNNKQTLEETRRNTALVLLNQHVALSFPRPYSPNMIEVGGIQINREKSPLPADIEKFINGSEHGVIYFSMGSNLRSKDIPLETRKEILKALGSIKQRVLWKFEDSNLEGKPDNVFIKDWFPQDDVLAHEKVIAFVTHGGLLSSTEAIYHGKPLVGIPAFADQFLNMARAEKAGYAITLNLWSLKADKFIDALQRITSDTKYTNIMRKISAEYRDQKETPVERAVYWVEHVTRHKGAKYLRSASQDLNFIQYHNLDAMLVLYGGIVFVVYVLVLGISRAVKNILFTQLKTTTKVKKN